MINLLPEVIREERKFGRKNRILLGYSVAIIITAFLVAGIMIGSIQFVGQDVKAIEQDIAVNEQEVASLEQEISDLKQVADRLELANTLYEQNIIFSELIPQIGSVLPRGTVINGLSLTGGNTDPLSLNVNLTSADLVPTLQKNLVESELFEAADIGSIAPFGSDGPYSFTATVDVSFTGTAEAKAQEEAAAAARASAAAEASAGGSE